MCNSAEMGIYPKASAFRARTPIDSPKASAFRQLSVSSPSAFRQLSVRFPSAFRQLSVSFPSAFRVTRVRPPVSGPRIYTVARRSSVNTHLMFACAVTSAAVFAMGSITCGSSGHWHTHLTLLLWQHTYAQFKM